MKHKFFIATTAQLLILCAIQPVFGQARLRNERMFQFSIAPGFGTNGLDPGTYSNYFSFNLTSGYSAANLAFELGIVSNLNVNRTRGIQIAGIANVTGANAFSGLNPKEKDVKIRSGYEANLDGAQIAGGINYVLSNVRGFQVGGAGNVSHGSLTGVQIGGISNRVDKYTFGFQLAGLSNISKQSMDGAQVSLLYNHTSGELSGLQLGAINIIGSDEGPNSVGEHAFTGFQFGLINTAKRMNGYQVGLINFAGQSQGFQLGLINIYKKGKSEAKDGTAIGLVNIGDFGYLSAYANDLFTVNYEIATGNIKNRKIKTNRNVYYENALIYSRNPDWGYSRSAKWAVGYGLNRMIFNRPPSPTQDELRFLSLAIDAMHISFGKPINREMSLLLKPKVKAGFVIHPRLAGVYLIGGLSYNIFIGENDNPIGPSFLNSVTKKDGRTVSWPGFEIGLMIH